MRDNERCLFPLSLDCRDVNCVHLKMVPSRGPTMEAGLMLYVHCTYRRYDSAMYLPWNQLYWNWFLLSVSIRHVIFVSSKERRAKPLSVLVWSATKLDVKTIFMLLGKSSGF